MEIVEEIIEWVNEELNIKWIVECWPMGIWILNSALNVIVECKLNIKRIVEYIIQNYI